MKRPVDLLTLAGVDTDRLRAHLAYCGWHPAAVDVFTGDRVEEPALKAAVPGVDNLWLLSEAVAGYLTASGDRSMLDDGIARLADDIADNIY